MKIEKLDNNKSKIKIAFLCGFVICAIIFILINIFITKANYRKTENIPLAKGTINYTLVDFEIVEIKIDGQPSTKMPEGNYELTNDSYCTEKDDQFQDTPNPEIQLSYQNNILSVSNYTKKGTKCHLVFKKKVTSEDTLAKWDLSEYANDEIAKFTGTSCLNGCTVSENGIYKAEDNDGTSYYFRGTVDYNWVKFGTTDSNVSVWWRIVRINGDGTIRLIYAGTGEAAPSPTDANSVVAKNQYYSVSGNYNNNTYVGFYTGSTGGTEFKNTHSNTTASNVATKLKDWYEGNDWKAEDFEQYIDEDAGFCNDRTIHPTAKTWYTSEGDSNRGTGTVATAYGPFSRIMTISGGWNTAEQTPTLICGKKPGGTGNEVSDEDYKRDLYTLKKEKRTNQTEVTKGNGALDVPVGLITADEVIFAGGFGGESNDGYYLYNNQYFWTMSPRNFGSGYAYVFYVNVLGTLTYNNVNGTTPGVRPVINLKADAPISFQNGDDNKGTTSNPYVVVTE